MPQDSEWYVPVEHTGDLGEPAPNLSFMVHALLSSRVETGLPDEDSREDDVNIYLTHLLCAYIRPTYHLRVRDYISVYNSSVFEHVRTSTNKRFKYTVYKANADHILMMMGLFQNPTGTKPTSLMAPLQLDENVHVGHGKAYYDFAFTYSRSLFGPSSGITDVLGKLAAGFERYLRLLEHLRGEYFNLIDRLSEGELYHLERDIQGQEVHQFRNRFLDAYAEFRRDPTPERRAQVEQAAETLRRLDPDFRFDGPEIS
jgi:hypothetical protein